MCRLSEVRIQLTGVSSVLPLCGSWKQNSGHQLGDIKHLYLLSYLVEPPPYFFFKKSCTKTGVYWLGQTGWQTNLKDASVSTYWGLADRCMPRSGFVSGHCGSKVRSPRFHSKHSPDSHFPSSFDYLMILSLFLRLSLKCLQPSLT